MTKLILADPRTELAPRDAGGVRPTVEATPDGARAWLRAIQFQAAEYVVAQEGITLPENPVLRAQELSRLVARSEALQAAMLDVMFTMYDETDAELDISKMQFLQEVQSGGLFMIAGFDDVEAWLRSMMEGRSGGQWYDLKNIATVILPYAERHMTEPCGKCKSCVDGEGCELVIHPSMFLRKHFVSKLRAGIPTVLAVINSPDMKPHGKRIAIMQVFNMAANPRYSRRDIEDTYPKQSRVNTCDMYIQPWGQDDRLIVELPRDKSRRRSFLRMLQRRMGNHVRLIEQPDDSPPEETEERKET